MYYQSDEETEKRRPFKRRAYSADGSDVRMEHAQAATAAAEPTSRYATINGLRLHYLDWGGDSASHTIVLVHGGTAHVHWWDAIAPLLLPYGRVVAFDFRGHGRSEWPRPAAYGPLAHISDLREFIARHLQAPVVLVGHSMGGELSLRIVVRHPELVEGFVSIDAPAGGPPLLTRLKWRWKRRRQGGARPDFASAEELIRRFRLSPPGHNLTEEQLAELALKGAEQLPNGRWAFRFDPEARAWRHRRRDWGRVSLRKIARPTLIIRGRHSALMTPAAARRMHRRTPGARFVEIHDAHHHVPLDNPRATAAAIGEFIEALESGAR